MMRNLGYLILILILSLSCVPREKSKTEDFLTVKTETPALVETVFVVKPETVIVSLEEIPAKEEVLLPAKAETPQVSKEVPAEKRVTSIFKVQVGAFRTKKEALEFQEKLKSKFAEESYIEKEETPPCWKVRIGYFNTFEKASILRDKLKEKGLEKVWIKRKKAPSATKVETPQVSKEMPTGEKVIGIFKIQVGAFKTQKEALEFQEELKNKFNEESYIEKKETPPFWKVRIGYFNVLQEAYTLRDKLKEKGLKNAWVVWEK